MGVEPARARQKTRARAATLMASLGVVAAINLIAVGLVLSRPADAATFYVDCPAPITEGETAHMKIRRPGHRIVWTRVYTHSRGHTARANDYVPYDGDQIFNNGDKSLWIPIVTKEDSQPEHDETFEIEFAANGVWRGCVVTIDDDDLPEVREVEISSRPVRGDTYRAGESIDVTVTLDQEVEVTGRPLLSLFVDGGRGGGWRGADYLSGSGTRSLIFRYRVAARDRDFDGVSVAIAVMEGDGNPTEGFVGDGQIFAKGTDVPIDYTHDGVASSTGHKVDGRPYVQRILVTSAPPAGGDFYRANQIIEITLQFNTDVVAEGRVYAPLLIGLERFNWAEALRQADYLRGSGTDTLVFGYTVQPGDMDAEGISIAGSAADNDFDGGGTIKAKGTDVEWDPVYRGVDHLPRHRVDTAPPAISSISFESEPEAGEAYGIGQLIAVRARFDEKVTASGDLQLELDVGGTPRQATLQPAAAGDTLVFRYEVQEGDSDTDGVGIPANALRLNGGSVHDRAGNAAGLSHEAVLADPVQKVDTSPEE